MQFGNDNICDECGYENKTKNDSNETESDGTGSIEDILNRFGNNSNSSNNDRHSSGGCFSSVGGGAVAIISIVALCGAMLRRKKRGLK